MAVEEQTPFATLLKRYRAASGLTQEGLAEHAGLSREAVSALERGGRLYPRPDTIELLADALELSAVERAALVRSAARPSRPRRAVADARAGGPPDAVMPAHHLPTPPTRLLGRERELSQACSLIGEDGVRLLTVTGPPGVGKTRFALEVAAAVAHHFGDGVAFVPLASLTTPEFLADTLVRALGASAGAHARPLETLVARLADTKLLLVLDNFEHLRSVAPVLTDLLIGCSRLTLLVTSRGILQLRGERALPLSPLALPESALSVSAVAKSPAVALFVSSSQSVRPEFELTPDNAADVVAVCRRLDGLPLALELAAARSRLLPPRALLARLERRLPTLTSGAADLPERHKTLRAALAWSYELLSSREQQVFRSLSVFSGGATLDAAARICTQDTSSDNPDLIDQLASLVDHELILPAEDSVSGEPRTRMLETMREFGQEQLAATGEAMSVQRAHADYFLHLAIAANKALQSSRPANWMSRLDEEIDNLRAALAWSRDHVEGAPELGLQLCGALGWNWLLSGRLREGRAWCESILAASDNRGEPLSRGHALLATAILARAQGDIDVACAHAETAAETFRSLDEIQLLAGALTLLSRVRVNQGNPAAALDLIPQIRKLLPDASREDGRFLHVRLGFYEGRALAAAGDLAAARSCYQTHLAMLEGLGVHRLRPLLLSALGDLAFASGDETGADVLFAQALPGLQPEYAGSKWDLALQMVNMGFSKLRHDELDAATELISGSLHKWLEQGVRPGIGLGLRGLGGLAAAQGDANRAGLLCGASTLLLSSSDAFLLEARGAAAAAERCLADARARSNPDSFDEGWRSGVCLAEADALSLALESSDLRQ